jgi:hypothetical protein
MAALSLGRTRPPSRTVLSGRTVPSGRAVPPGRSGRTYSALVITVVHNPEDSRIRQRQIDALLNAGWQVTYRPRFVPSDVTYRLLATQGLTVVVCAASTSLGHAAGAGSGRGVRLA